MSLGVTSEFCQPLNFVEPLFLYQQFGYNNDCPVHTSEGFGAGRFTVEPLVKLCWNL